MEDKVIFAEEYHLNIPLLLISNRTGTVHSIFENGVNIRMGERLIFIGTNKNGRLPFGIHLGKEVIRELITLIETTSLVYWDDETKCFNFENNGLSVSLERATPFNNIVYPSTDYITSTQSIHTFIQVLLGNGETTGLDLDIGQFIIDYLEKRLPDHTVAREVYRLMEALYSDDGADTEKAARYFLGRGKGLTPTGDDHFVGLLAIQRISNTFSQTFLQTVKKILEREMITTDIGKEYLLYALNGEFSSSVVNILNAILAGRTKAMEKHLLQLLTMGHSSGVDTSFGMFIGLLSIMKRRTQ